MSDIAAWAADRDSVGPRRWLQIGMGIVWVLDAALQYQPYMFSRGFVTNIVDPASSGNPAAIAGPVAGAGRILLHDVVLFNAAFATVQLAIGLGLLWRRTVRAALAGTIAWGMAVWLLGEGLGGILTGSASPLTGAPGAAVLYVLLAVLIWPRHAPARGLTAQRRGAAAGPAASVAARQQAGAAVVAAILAAPVGKLRIFPAAGTGPRARLPQLDHRGGGSRRARLAGLDRPERCPGRGLGRRCRLGRAGDHLPARRPGSVHPGSDPPRPGPGGHQRGGHLGADREPGRHLHRHGHRPQHRTPADPAGRRILAVRAAAAVSGGGCREGAARAIAGRTGSDRPGPRREGPRSRSHSR